MFEAGHYKLLLLFLNAASEMEQAYFIGNTEKRGLSAPQDETVVAGSELFPASPTAEPNPATLGDGEQHLGLFYKKADPAPSFFPAQHSYLTFKSIT